MRPFEGKVAIVTGGSAGLGAAAALQFAPEGAMVVLAARREDQSESVLRQIEALGGEGLFIRTDVNRDAGIQALVEGALASFGRLDCAVNNAGIARPVRTPVAEIEERRWDEVMNVNQKRVWLCMKHEIPPMLAQGAGAIVNVASIYGFKPSDIGHAACCASNFGVIGLSRSAAVDYGQMGIGINAVAPVSPVRRWSIPKPAGPPSDKRSWPAGIRRRTVRVMPKRRRTRSPGCAPMLPRSSTGPFLPSTVATPRACTERSSRGTDAVFEGRGARSAFASVT